MPQLDQVTYFSQFFWLCFFYFLFYVFLVKIFLPRMSRLLKLRQKKLTEGLRLNSVSDNKVDLLSDYHAVLFQGIQQAHNTLLFSSTSTSEKFNYVLNKVNQEVLRLPNQDYLLSLFNVEASSSLFKSDISIFSKGNIQMNREKLNLLYDQKVIKLMRKYSKVKK